MGSIKMKTLALTALVGLGLAGAVYAVTDLTKPADRIAIREEVIYGDKAATEGLTLDWNLKAMNHLSWDSHITLGQQEPVAVTDHRFHLNTHWNQWNWVPGGVNIYDRMDGFFRPYLSNAEELDFDYVPEKLMGMVEEQIQMRADELEREGAIRITDVKAKDYFDYYPLQVGTDLPILLYSETEGGMDRFRQNTMTIRDFFRIPMLEEQYIEIEVVEDPRMNGLDITNRWDGEAYDAFYLYTECVYTDRNCYLWFSNRTDRNKLVDTDQIPGGYGIYVLPYGPVEGEENAAPQRKNSTMDVRNAKYDLYTDQLRLFYAVPEEDYIYHVSLSLAGDRLLLYVEEAGRLVCRVIDGDTAETLQVLDLGPAGEKDRYVTVIDNNDKVRNEWYQQETKDMDITAIAASTPLESLYAQDFGWVAFIEEGWLNRTGLVARQPDGTYAVPILLDATDVERQGNFGPVDSYPYTMYYDGYRLALSGTFDRRFYEGGNYTPTAAYLLVYTPEGLQYYGVLQNSLMDANAITGLDWPDSVQWYNNRALKLR